MRPTRTVFFLLAATAATLTSCGVTKPVTFNGQPNSITSEAEAEANFIEEVRDSTDSDYVGDIDDETIVGFGDEVCDDLDSGQSKDDIAEAIYDAAEGDMDAAEQLAIIAGVAMRELCPQS